MRRDFYQPKPKVDQQILSSRYIGDTTDYQKLITRLTTLTSPELRADVLATVLRVADETNPQFEALVNTLTESERALVLGTLLAATRLEPSAERRLLRLKQLLRVMPEESRGLFWAEAEGLSKEGSDDTPLILLGVARGLTLKSPIVLTTLRKAVKRVQDVFKRAMALIALSELTQLSNSEWREAERCARRIPDETLRIMTLIRLSKVKRS
jgi:hypothetical protein